MSVRRFNDSNGRLAWVLTHVDAVVGLDGKPLSQTLNDMNEKIDDIEEITSATGTITEDGGNPSVDISIVDGAASFAFKNIQGPVGPQGDSFQPIEDVTGLVLSHTLGQDNTKAISQKGVTDAIGEYKEQAITRIKDSYISNGAIASSSTQHCWWAPVKIGDIIKVTATNSSNKAFRVGFATVKPAIGVSISNTESVASSGVVNYTVVSEVNGYVVLNHGSSDYSNQKLEIVRYANIVELDTKARQNSLNDVLQAASVIMAENAITATSISEKCLLYDGNVVEPITSNWRVYAFDVQEGKIYRINGRVPENSGYVGYMFVDEFGAKIEYGELANGTARRFTTDFLIAPKGAATLYVSGWYTGEAVGKLYEIVPATTDEQKEQARRNLGVADVDEPKTIYPKMGYEHIRESTGKHNMSDQGLKFVATMRFIKVNGSFTATVVTNQNQVFSGGIRVFKYAEDFSYISFSDYEVEAANQAVEIDPGDAAYVKLYITDTYSSSAVSATNDIPLVRLALTGKFRDKWDYYNIAQNKNENGYDTQTLIARVWVTDPTCCDEETNDVQDDGELLTDYGCLRLPATYSNIGEPTRLIIHCHGAGVNYNEVGGGHSSSTEPTVPRFDAQDLEAGYWLAEGYAVMDVEGNPFNNVNEHFSMPQAMDCYVSAYKWVINHYNIKRDGVFLEGRSMGGGTAIMLSRDECPIPVIAVCPNAPAAKTSFGSPAERKAFWATHCGFELPNGFSWQSGYVTAEKQIFFDNWDKWIKCTPLFGWVNDLPTNDTEKWALLDAIWGQDMDFFKAMHAHCKCPVKFFCCQEDTVCPPDTTAKVYYKMLMNSGQRAEIRVYHTSLTGDNAHHYDTQDTNLRTTVTTRFGEELGNIPVVYVEMLKFWRRYEQD